MNYVLQHHGVKGQKWGVRRYQNSDGTLTETGRRRLGQISDNSRRVTFDSNSGRIDNNPDNQRRARSAIHQSVADDYNDASNIARNSGNISNSASNIVKQSANDKRQKGMQKMDVSKMSDKELREAINRMNLEKNYKSLSTENITSGRDHLSYVLSTAGSVLAVGSSAASIAVSIHKLMS